MVLLLSAPFFLLFLRGWREVVGGSSASGRIFAGSSRFLFGLPVIAVRDLPVTAQLHRHEPKAHDQGGATKSGA